MNVVYVFIGGLLVIALVCAGYNIRKIMESFKKEDEIEIPKEVTERLDEVFEEMNKVFEDMDNVFKHADDVFKKLRKKK